MNLKLSTDINASSQLVWKIVAEEFEMGGKWMTGVHHSHAFGDEGNSGGPCQGRICTLEPQEGGLKVKKHILGFDKKNFILVFDVHPIKEKGLQLPVTKNTVKVTLSQLKNNQTRVNWESRLELNWVRKFLKPLLFIGFNRAFKGILSDLKIYTETGKVSTKKLKFDQKFNAKKTVTSQ